MARRVWKAMRKTREKTVLKWKGWFVWTEVGNEVKGKQNQGNMYTPGTAYKSTKGGILEK